MIAGRTHFVYRCFDANDKALYVGCTVDVRQRMYRHASKDWYSRVARTEVTEHPDQASGLKVEAAEILRLWPEANRQKKYWLSPNGATDADFEAFMATFESLPSERSA